MDAKRPTFFLIGAIAAALLIPASDSKLRYVAIVVSATYAVLAALFALDVLSRRRR